MADEAEQKDVVLLGGPTEDGKGVQVLRARNDTVETGELRALEDGKPVTGEIVTLRPREGAPRVCDVETAFAPPKVKAPAAPPHKGPARVASDAYRSGWDEIFTRPSKSLN